MKAGMNRDFDIERDLMALYRELVEIEEFEAFCTWVWDSFDESGYTHKGPYSGSLYFDATWIAWLLCLSGEGYEERCEMVGEYLRGRSK